MDLYKVPGSKKQNDFGTKDLPSPPLPTEPPPAVFRQPVPTVSLPVSAQGVIGLNTRLPAAISTALLTASISRKIQRLAPFTQQDIVAEALQDWLRKHGFQI